MSEVAELVHMPWWLGREGGAEDGGEDQSEEMGQRQTGCGAHRLTMPVYVLAMQRHLAVEGFRCQLHPGGKGKDAKPIFTSVRR